MTGALVLLGALALAYGYDSRDGLRGDEGARWEAWF